MGGFAWVTLATNDSYSLGALVLAHSLKRVNTAHQLAIMITPGVSEAMRTQLSAVFNVVKLVDVLDSKDQENLALLARPELGITFTKLHCWKLTQFDKCVFLDADTIVLQNSDELFEREELSAAPDVGWPDCFNSGVFVFKPSEKTFTDLIDFALVHGTFDGGDQGLLNLFFSDWATKDISKHLPFVYNVVSSTVYTYLPAFKQFKDKLKIIHFIGSSKPWLQPFDTETGVARVSGDAQTQSTFIQLWWDLFCAYVHPTLTSSMAGLAGALSAVKLGAPRSEEENALQEHLRRQGWEEGNIDYMGRDSFDNIWKKISETLASGTSPSQPPEPTTVQAPVTETVQSSAIPESTAAPPSVPSTLPTSEITPQPETVPTAPITQLQEKPIESVPTPISEPPKTESSEKVAKTEQIPTTVPTTPVAAQPTPQPDLKTTETPQEKPSEVLLTSNEQKPLEELKVTALAPTSPPSDPTKVEPAFIPPEPLKTDIKPAESAAEQKPVTPSMPSSKPEVPQQVESAKTDVVAPKVDTTPQPIFSPPTPSAPETTSPTTAAVPTPASPQTVSPPQATTPTPQTKQEHPPSQASSTPSDLKPLESGKTTSITEAPKEIATGKSDLTPPPSPGQVPVAVPEPKQTPPTPSTPTVTSPTPPASPAAVPPELPTAASKLKVQPETPPTPPVPQSAAQPTLPGSTGDEPPVPPKRKGGKGGSGATAAPAAAQAESASKPQQPKGGKGGKGKK